MRVFALLNALAFTVVLVAAVQDVDQSAELADVGDLDQDLGIADLDALGLSDNDMEEMGDSNEADWFRRGGRRRFFRRPWVGRPFWGRRRRWGWRRARPWLRPSPVVSVGGGDDSQPGDAAPAEEPKADGDAEAPAAAAAEDAAAPAEAPADDAAPAEGDAAEGT